MLPALSVITSVAVGKATTRPESPVLARALAEPWGLVISEAGVEPLVAVEAKGAPLPDRDASPIAARDLQRILAAHAGAFRRCYEAEAPYVPGLAGDLIVSIALHDGHVQSAVSGKKSLRVWMGDCVRREVGRIEFPSTREVAWVHYPLRFVARQPPSQGAGNTSM